MEEPLTLAFRLLLVYEVELFVQKGSDQIQRRFNSISKDHLHPSSQPPCRRWHQRNRPCIKGEYTHMPNIHEIICTGVPWPWHGSGACHSPRNVSHTLWLPEIYPSVHSVGKEEKFKPQRQQRRPTAHGSCEPDVVVYLDTSPGSPPSYTGLEEKHT